MRFRGIVVLVTVVLAVLLSTDAQQHNLQSLSYPEGMQIQPHARPTTSTTPEPSTKKPGFFSGIRNFFGGKKKEEEASTPSTISTPSTVSTPKPSSAQPSTQATSTTITTKKPTPKEDFPALPGQRNQANPVPPLSPTVPSAWNRPTSVPGGSSPRPPVPPSTTSHVKFVPPSPQPPVPIYTTKVTTPATVIEGSPEHEVIQVSEQLFAKDTTNLKQFVTPNYQKQTVSYSTQDDAPQKFLTVDEGKLFAVNTISKMRALYNNYELDASVNEHESALEKNEEGDFIDSLLATNVMRTLMQFLQKKDKVTADPKTHKDLLKTIWFTMYSRGQGRIGSSGFEHVFLAENKNNSIVGLHNWVYLYEMEKAGHLDYKGWLKKIDFGNKGAVAKIRFSYDNLNKPVNGMFLGTSPELEIGLYTLCFEMFPDSDCILSAGGPSNRFKIKTYTFRYRGKRVIGSAYPEVL